VGEYFESKPVTVSPYLDATPGGAAGFARVEAYITAERLRNEFLFGIPLYSILTRQYLPDDTITSIINRSAAATELKCNISIFKVQREVRQSFDRTKFSQGFGEIDLLKNNVLSIEEVSIRTINTPIYNGTGQQLNPPFENIPGREHGYLLYKFPLEWIDTSPMFMRKGLIHFVPLQTVPGNTGISGLGSTGPFAPLFATFSKMQWIPSFWYIRCTHGFEESAIPAPINELVATVAAMEILSMLAITYRNTSQSIGIDGVSQGLTLPGPRIYELRMSELAVRKAELESIIKSYFGSSIFMTSI
jgi:hypothetical protein